MRLWVLRVRDGAARYHENPSCLEEQKYTACDNPRPLVVPLVTAFWPCLVVFRVH